jgi:hypothetical protein
MTTESAVHSINFGVLYNNYPNMTPSIDSDEKIKRFTYTFKSHNVTLDEFKNIFYLNENGLFYINEAYRNSKFINFSLQQVEFNDEICRINNLNEYIVAAYEEILHVSRNSFNSMILIDLQRDILKYKSLYDLCGMNVYHKFKNLNEIFDNYEKLNNSVVLNLVFIYSNPLFENIEIIFNFNYNVDLST